MNGVGGDPVYTATGGNPAGFLRAMDGVGGVPTLMVAPAKFLGNKIFSYGLFLRFDLKVLSGGAPNTSTNGDIRIFGGGTSLFANISGLPNTITWTSYSIKLDETQLWRVGSSGGPVATKEQLKIVLTSLTAIQINVEYNSLVVGDQGGIDNVILEQRQLLPAPATVSLPPCFQWRSTTCRNVLL